MVSGYWLAIEAIVLLGLGIYTNRVNYHCGIWDGAFNHFLPVVKREMMRYDERRAKAIFDQEVTNAST